jgi:hypothetical protein
LGGDLQRKSKSPSPQVLLIESVVVIVIKWFLKNSHQGKQSGNVLQHFPIGYPLQNCFENFKFDFVSNFLVPFGLVFVCLFLCL